MADRSPESDGICVCMVLFIMLLVLKLTGSIDWSWWRITSPLWIPAAIFVTIVVPSRYNREGPR